MISRNIPFLKMFYAILPYAVEDLSFRGEDIQRIYVPHLRCMKF